MRVLVKWENLGLLERIYREGRLESRGTREDGTFVDAWVPPALGAKLLDQALESPARVEGPQFGEHTQNGGLDE